MALRYGGLNGMKKRRRTKGRWVRDLERNECFQHRVHKVNPHFHQQGDLVLEALVEALVVLLCLGEFNFGLRGVHKTKKRK